MCVCVQSTNGTGLPRRRKRPTLARLKATRDGSWWGYWNLWRPAKARILVKVWNDTSVLRIQVRDARILSENGVTQEKDPGLLDGDG